MRKARLAVAAFGSTQVVAPAAAQLLYEPQTVVVPPEPALTSAQSAFARGGDVSVAERNLPAFSAQGLTLGNFQLFPGLPLGFEYTSNVFADNRRRTSDVALVARPEVTFRTSGGPYQVDLYAKSDLRHYFGHGSESTEEILGGGDATVAIGALSFLSGGVSYGSLIDPRFSSDSPVDAAKPLEYRDLSGNLLAHFEGASTRLILRANVERLRFSDAPALDGGEIDTRDRDRTRVDGLARLERALSPAFSLYGAVSGNRISYVLPTTGGLSRDSAGYGFYLGSSFEVTRLIRGDVRLGYIRQEFDQPGVRPIAGLGAQGKLLIFPNRLWTFTATGESTITDTGVPGAAAVLHRGGSVRADYEFRRYLIASFGGGYFLDSYRGEARRDRLPMAEASAVYLSRNHWNARLGYRFAERHSGRYAYEDGVADYDDHRVTATLTFQY